MNSRELRILQEAYLEVYEERDPSHPHWETNRQFKKSEKENRKLISAAQKRKEDRQRNRNPLFFGPSGKMTKTQREQVDIYDIILSHLLDEGYAEATEAAEVIMVNMSEDWREDIVEKFISPFKGRVSYNNPQGLSPATKAGQKSDELQRTQPGSERQRKQTRRSQQLDRLYHAAKTAHLR